MKTTIGLAFLVTVSSMGCAHERHCDRSSAIQVLGSGGPIPDDDRASSGYLVWIRGRARVLVDAGGGVFQRFGQAGGRVVDLDAILLSHLHADHSADVPVLLKGASFSSRRRDLPLVGPSEGNGFPGMRAWVDGMFGPQTGAFRYLSWLVEHDEGAFSLAVEEIDAEQRRPVAVLTTQNVDISAVGVEHGPVPALAYRVQVGEHIVVFSGDFSGVNSHLADLARGADILVMHHAIPENATGTAARLHARPSEIGTIAAEAKVPHLVLSHHMKRSLDDLDASLSSIGRTYSGKVTVADDLMCIPIAGE